MFYSTSQGKGCEEQLNALILNTALTMKILKPFLVFTMLKQFCNAFSFLHSFLELFSIIQNKSSVRASVKSVNVTQNFTLG